MTLDRKGKNAETSNPLWIEWGTGIVSLVLVAGLIGWVAVDLVFAKDNPPDLTVGVTAVDKVESGWLVRFEIANMGSQTAAEVQVEGNLEASGETVEEASATVDYVPGQSKARGGLIFFQNPDEMQLTLRAVGYRQP
ncbi:TIGR02588 family protein [Rhizobium sp. AAP43]|uniref:TIGR02588 family protein n=1 Tax=Rhizobium sp. AAP43 TaxID=1523420 RepID=UPI0006B902F5|nr:TIGR02588 family protein [Rhizobium sp. AAP43]KPF42408.1 hypothetical protein IP76_17340 [Rhizobium sp. AAP43]